MFTMVFDVAFVVLSFYLVCTSGVAPNIRWMALGLLSGVGALLNTFFLPKVGITTAVAIIGMVLLAINSFCNYREVANN